MNSLNKLRSVFFRHFMHTDILIFSITTQKRDEQRVSAIRLF
jgi:hypothetical protein